MTPASRAARVFRIVAADTPELGEQARALIADHTRAFGVDPARPDFVREMEALPGGEYAPPRGTLLLALGPDGEALGCIAVRPVPARFDVDAAELRRMYVVPEARRKGIGRALVREAVAFARSAGYPRASLVSLRDMDAAHRLYGSEGFAFIAPYRPSYSPDVVYMGMALAEPERSASPSGQGTSPGR